MRGVDSVRVNVSGSGVGVKGEGSGWRYGECDYKFLRVAFYTKCEGVKGEGSGQR